MVMFGAPIMAIGLTLPFYWLLQRLLRVDLRGAVAGILTSGVLLALLVAPFADMIPAMSQGPIINRRHAEALSRAKAMTPPDAMLWLWWDWGYAANHFAQRQTIADGAQHAGPSLYLPAAVFATDNPRFARQIIRYTAQCGNEPGNVFEGLDGEGAQALMDRLRSPETPLIDSLTLTGSYNDADGGKQALEIMAEAIQSAPEEAAGQAWGVTITPGRVARYQ